VPHPPASTERAAVGVTCAALPKGILFDLDDTLIAYDVVAEQLWRDLCEHYARRMQCADTVNPEVAEHLHATLREVRDWYWDDATRHREGRLNLKAARRDIVRRVFAKLGWSDMALADEMADTYSREREEAVYCFPGVIETLQALVDRGVKLALITNGTSALQRRKVERFGLAPYFTAILIEGELGYGKPDPAVYLHALEALELAADEVWVVGDNLEWEVAAPQRLGMTAIWHDAWGQGLPPDCPVVPDRIVHRISELAPTGTLTNYADSPAPAERQSSGSE
jgi:putative hydrolase of the HAD superfamily